MYDISNLSINFVRRYDPDTKCSPIANILVEKVNINFHVLSVIRGKFKEVAKLQKHSRLCKIKLAC